MGKRDRSGVEDGSKASKRGKLVEEVEEASESKEVVEVSGYVEHKKVRSMSAEEAQRLREEMSMDEDYLTLMLSRNAHL